MVRRRLRRASLAFAFLAGVACGEEREMAGEMEMPDSMPIMEALQDARARDALLDTMPGGEMARGDSLAEMELLKRKM